MKRIVLFCMLLAGTGILSYPQENTLIDSMIVYRYWNGEDSVPYRKVIYERDIKDTLLSSLTYKWDSLNLRWVLDEKKEYEYVFSGTGYRKISRGYAWSSGTGEWVKSLLDTVVRDEANRPLLVSSYRWDTAVSRWTGTARREKEYNDDGYILRNEKFFWLEGGWQCDSLDVHEYVFGRLTCHFLKSWSDDAHACVNVSRTDYDYNADDELSAETFYNGYGTQWLKNRKKEYTYNRELQAVETITEYTWQNNRWQDYAMEEFTYDDKGRVTAHYRYRAGEDIDPWEMIRKTLFTYEDYSTCSRIVSETYEWDYEISEWVGVEKWEGVTYLGNFDNGKWRSKMYYSWDPDQKNWVMDREEIYLYYSSSELWRKEERVYDPDEQTWSTVKEWIWGLKVNGIVLSYEYYEYNYMIEKWYYQLDYNNKVTAYWHYRGRLDGTRYNYKGYTNTYGSNGRVAEHVDYIGYGSEWRKVFRYVYGYEGFLFSDRDTICYGDSIVWRGRYIKEAGIYRDSLVSVTERDSVFEMDLTVNGAYLPVYVTLCSGDSILWRGRYYKEAGMYYDSVPTMRGCDSVYALSLSLLPSPEPFTIDGPATTLEHHQDYYAVPEDTSLTYFWSFINGSLSSQLSGHEVLVKWGDAGAGAVNVVAENRYRCRSDTVHLDITVVALTGVDDAVWENIRVYPNPVHDRLEVDIPGRMRYELVDVRGVAVSNGFINGHGTLDMSYLPAGVYFLKMEGRRMFRIVKE